MSGGMIRKEQTKAAARMYGGARWTWLQTPLTSTSWDGDAKAAAADGTIDLSAVFGVPAYAKAVAVRLSIKDETTGVAASLSADVSALGAVVARTQVANIYTDASGIVPCDANGDIYIDFTDEVDNCTLQIWGYSL